MATIIIVTSLRASISPMLVRFSFNRYVATSTGTSARTRSVLSLSEVKIGLVPATIGPYVIRAVGQRTARRLFISGERVAAHAAQNMGLLHSVVEDEQLDDAVQGVVSALLENSPHAMRVAKQVVFALAPDTVTDEMIDFSVETIAAIRESDEGREGTAAFLEKRSPSWVNS